MPVSEQDFRKLAARIEKLERHTHKLPSRFVPPSGGGGGGTHHIADDLTALTALISSGKADEGHTGYAKDTNKLYIQTGSAWTEIDTSSILHTAANKTALDAISADDGHIGYTTGDDIPYVRVNGAWRQTAVWFPSSTGAHANALISQSSQMKWYDGSSAINISHLD